MDCFVSDNIAIKQAKHVKKIDREKFFNYSSNRQVENPKYTCVSLIYPNDINMSTKPEWIRSVNEDLTTIVHKYEKINDYMKKFFIRMEKRLKEFPSNVVKMAVKGSAPLKFWFDNNLERLPDNVKDRYKNFSEKYLKPSDWDSDIIINSLLEKDEIIKVRAILDVMILQEMKYLKKELEDDYEISEFLKNFDASKLSSKMQNYVYDLYSIPRRSFYIKFVDESQKEIFFRETLKFPILKNIPEMNEYGPFPNDDYIEGSDKIKLNKLYNKYVIKNSGIPVLKKSNIYISRNIAIRPVTEEKFDLYRLQSSYQIIEKINKDNYHNIKPKIFYTKAELIDITVYLSSKTRDIMWEKYKNVFKVKGFNMLHPGIQIKDLIDMTNNVSNENQAAKLNKRLKRLKFLKRLECHLGKQIEFRTIFSKMPKNMTRKEINDYFKEKEKQFESYCKEIKTPIPSKRNCVKKLKSEILEEIGKKIYNSGKFWAIKNNKTNKDLEEILSKYGVYTFTPLTQDSFAKFTNNYYTLFSKRELCNIEKEVKYIINIEKKGFIELLKWINNIWVQKRNQLYYDEFGFLDEIQPKKRRKL